MKMSTFLLARFRRAITSKQGSVLIALLILVSIVSFMSPFFLTSRNIFNVLRQFSIIAILSVGQAMIIIIGGIDLSVGFVTGLMGVLTGLIARLGVPWPGVFVLVVLLGVAVGFINAVMITRIGINPFIATLGMFSIARGTSLLLTGGMPVAIRNPITFMGGGYVGPVPMSAITMFVVATLGHIIMTRTVFGRNIYAIGNNPRAAELSGIRVDRTRTIVHMIMGALTAIAGMTLSGTLATAEPAAGGGYELDVIAAVVIGGASLSGGEGSIIGVILGAALMGVLRNSFVLLGISAYWQVVSIGVVIIIAVAIDSIKTKRRG